MLAIRPSHRWADSFLVRGIVQFTHIFVTAGKGLATFYNNLIEVPSTAAKALNWRLLMDISDIIGLCHNSTKYLMTAQSL